MKIQCDVCEKEEATVFCSADEAALCDGCDRRVHRANKLASKHTRYSLLHPSFKDSPLCDICKERRALLFCREDRAILCKECDIPIHIANEHTKKHSRFLLTGVRLSPSSSSSFDATHHLHQPPRTSSSTGGLWRQESSSSSPKHQLGFVNPSFEVRPSGAGAGVAGQEEEEEIRMVVGNDGSMAASSISEYLMETLPGWRVDEFLDCSSNNNPSISHGYCKTSDQMLPMPDYEFRSDKRSGSTSWRDLPISVPQFFAQSHLHHHHNHNPPLQIQTSSFNGAREPEKKARSSKSSRRRSEFSQGIHTFAP